MSYGFIDDISGLVTSPTSTVRSNSALLISCANGSPSVGELQMVAEVGALDANELESIARAG